MAGDIGVKISGQETAEAIAAKLKAGSDYYKQGLKLTMWRALTVLEAAILGEINRKLKSRTGRLRNSIPGSKEIYEESGEIVGTIGPQGVPYAAIQEFGGDIFPKNGKYLTLPLDAAAGPDGVARTSAREIIAGGKGLWFTSKKGNLILAVMQGKEVVPMFVMKEKVTIKEKRYLRDALDKNRDKLAKTFGLFIQENFSFKE